MLEAEAGPGVIAVPTGCPRLCGARATEEAAGIRYHRPGTSASRYLEVFAEGHQRQLSFTPPPFQARLDNSTFTYYNSESSLELPPDFNSQTTNHLKDIIRLIPPLQKWIASRR